MAKEKTEQEKLIDELRKPSDNKQMNVVKTNTVSLIDIMNEIIKNPKSEEQKASAQRSITRILNAYNWSIKTLKY